MANMTVENMSKIIQAGDVESMMGGGNAASEFKTNQIMRSEGMQVPAPGAGGAGTPGVGAPHEAGKNFSDIFQASMAQVNTDQVQANNAIKELVSGRNKNIHETMLTVERADTSLKLMMQVRNKVLDAYREIMRMQV